MDDVNQWWTGRPAERFWLEVTDREALGSHLRVPPCGRPEARLAGYVRPGDLVFHYLAGQEAIVARSIAGAGLSGFRRGWRSLLGRPDPVPRAVPLGELVPLAQPVTLEQIGRIQWHLFPALRALEEQVGDPLYYPFDMGPRGRTAPLRGRVFKLPALFVTAIPPLAVFAGAEAVVAAGWGARTAPPEPVVEPAAIPAVASEAPSRRRPPRSTPAPALDPAHWMILDS